MPVVSQISAGLGKVPGGVSGKAEEKLQDHIAEWVSGVDKETEGLKSKKKSSDQLNALNGLLFDKSMGALAKKPLLLYQLLDKQAKLAQQDPAHQQRPEWPPFMFKDEQAPLIPMEPEPTDPQFLLSRLKPEYVAD